MRHPGHRAAAPRRDRGRDRLGRCHQRLHRRVDGRAARAPRALLGGAAVPRPALGERHAGPLPPPLPLPGRGRARRLDHPRRRARRPGERGRPAPPAGPSAGPGRGDGRGRARPPGLGGGDRRGAQRAARRPPRSGGDRPPGRPAGPRRTGQRARPRPALVAGRRRARQGRRFRPLPLEPHAHRAVLPARHHPLRTGEHRRPDEHPGPRLLGRRPPAGSNDAGGRPGWPTRAVCPALAARWPSHTAHSGRRARGAGRLRRGFLGPRRRRGRAAADGPPRFRVGRRRGGGRR